MQTEVVEFKGFRDDLTFKYVFSYPKFLEDLINSYFEYIKEERKFFFTNFKAQEIIMANNKKLKNYIGDIIANLNTGEIINLEMFSSFNRRSYIKTYNYMCRLYSNQMNINEFDYEKCKKVISLNFITGNYRRVNNELVNTYKMKHDLTNKVIDNGEIEMVLIRLDLVEKIPYTESEERFIRWLRLINAKSIEEMENIAKGDEIMEHSVEYVKRYLNGPLNHTFEDYVADKEYVAHKEGEKIGEKNGRKIGEKIGERKGEKKGRKQGIIETARNLLKKEIPKDTIIEVTGLSLEEINNLERSV